MKLCTLAEVEGYLSGTDVDNLRRTHSKLDEARLSSCMVTYVLYYRAFYSLESVKHSFHTHAHGHTWKKFLKCMI